MRQLLYVSSTADEPSLDDLDQVLTASRRNNAMMGITGLLLFIDGGFLQVKGSIVTLLTNRAVDGAAIDSVAAQRALDAAQALPATTDEQYAAKLAADDAARQMLRMKRS